MVSRIRTWLSTLSLSLSLSTFADYKHALLQLPSARSLRSAFLAKLATTRAANESQHDQATATATVATITDSSAVLTPRYVRSIKGHSANVNCVAVSKDGWRIVSGSDDKTIKVWSTFTGQMLKTVAGHFYGVLSVALSSNADIAVSGSGQGDKMVGIWEPESGTVSHTLKGHTERVWGLAISHNGDKVASVSMDSTIKLWNAVSGEYEDTLTGHDDWVRCVAFSRDGQTLASGSVTGRSSCGI